MELHILDAKELLLPRKPIPWLHETPCLKKFINDSLRTLICFSTTALTTIPSSYSSFKGSNRVSPNLTNTYSTSKIVTNITSMFT